jgi:phosphoribosylamine--glycine ligase
VKATGLAAGKGVSVCDDESAAADAVKSMLGDRVFGDAGSSVLIEQRLVGPELSVFVVVDGKNYCWFAPSRDHKRLGDGDLGPNTGGMGAYTPVADASDAFMAKVDADILAPSVAQLAAQGFNYRGLLYVGLMLTPDGPMVLEYNCRFGDPETQVVLPTYDGDLFLLLNAAARGKLLERGQLARKGAAVGIVLAAANYPLTPRKGDRIDGLEQLTADSEIVFHAGTQRVDDRWLSAGGRVLTVVGQSAQLGGARDVANAASGRVSFDGAQRRNDIAKHETNNQ